MTLPHKIANIPNSQNTGKNTISLKMQQENMQKNLPVDFLTFGTSH